MDLTVAEAVALQEELRRSVDVTDHDPTPPRYVAGLDVAYDGDEYAAAVVVLEVQRQEGSKGLHEVDRAVALGRTSFPYVPGLFGFREVPGLVAALERLQVTPDLLVCDGQGLAHPRRFGMACHLGVVTGLPSIGVAKTSFVGDWQEPAAARGSVSQLLLDGDVVGQVVRTQHGVKPVFVSVGHRVSLETAVARVLELSPRYRLPETTRAADRACRDALADR
ncbi:deoxyribonuclease V [Kribbella sp. NPDC051770]|uniref:deoxyribonuclease V n=1 Tax=Kribbella sp. NPDC051770 TaxID=3155413 RepID=UPI003448834E